MSGFDNTMTFTNESAIDGSSPSAMSTGSQSGVSEAIIDGSNHQQTMTSSAGQWPNAMLAHAHAQAQAQAHSQQSQQQQQQQSRQMNIDFSGSIFQELCPPDTVSPKSLIGQTQATDGSFATPPPQTPLGPSMVSGADNMFSGTGNMSSSAHVDPFNHNFFQPAPQPLYITSITDTTRRSLMATLRQPSGFNHRRFSQPASNASVTSPGALPRANAFDTNSYILPSTADLQRYIAAYVNYFHPHMPFLHIPSLDFNSPEYTNKPKTIGGYGSSNTQNAPGGGGCLILSMAAIGALYEFDTATSKELSEFARKMIQLYLEERRKADMSAALNRSNAARDNSAHNTPLWLVQCMLLNVIYGHNCDDKTSADIASTHCAALVSLARAAELTRSHPVTSADPYANGDVHMNGGSQDHWGGQSELSSCPPEKQNWLRWKSVEERKRTLYIIFTLSSILVSAYNHAPALTNSEIRLTLPCDERIWTAESPQAWMALGGSVEMEQHLVHFSDALKLLLLAGQQPQHAQASQFGLTLENLKPSTFGCLVLIHALHNYIWETRQQHMGKQWTNQETEAMHLHIEPALRAWQTVWGSNPHHRVERPNPFGLGPLSADSVPLLDLAYIRLYVNMGRSKEAFWQRDWDAMTDELSRAADVVPHSPGSSDFTMSSNHIDANGGVPTSQGQDSTAGEYGVMPELGLSSRVRPSRNERHLRKAAFYAADSLCVANSLGITFAEFTSRELPIASAMCSFDCTQVLAEWIATIQDRIGPYLGILGQDPMDLNQVPAIMLLEDEDYSLIHKIEEFLGSIEVKMKDDMSQFGSSGTEPFNCPPSLVEGGYSTKVLFATAYLMNRAGVWPGEGIHNSPLNYSLIFCG
jgi:hypothetical protein